MKVLPAPAETRTLLCFGLPDQTAVEVMTLCLGTPFEVSGTVHLQAPLAAKLSDQDIARGRRRGHRHQDREFPELRALSRRPAEGAACRLFAVASSSTLRGAASSGRRSGPCAPLPARTARSGASPPRHRARRSSSPSSPAPSTSASLYDWSGGLIWLETPPTSDAGTVEIRRAIAEYRRPRHADPRRARDAGERRRVPAARAAARGADRAAESSLRSGRHSQSWPHVSRGLGATMQTNFSHEQLQTRPSPAPTPCSGAASIAASAPPPARPMCCSATSAIRPRGRIYLIKEMFEQARGHARRSPTTSTAASPASPA